jgi:hypothetical protein
MALDSAHHPDDPGRVRQGLLDTLAFFLLTADGLASLVATDLVGDALVTLEADGTAGGHLGVAGETEPVVAVSATRTIAVPAPAVLLLLAAALLPTLLRARR